MSKSIPTTFILPIKKFLISNCSSRHERHSCEKPSEKILPIKQKISLKLPVTLKKWFQWNYRFFPQIHHPDARSSVLKNARKVFVIIPKKNSVRGWKLSSNYFHFRQLLKNVPWIRRIKSWQQSWRFFAESILFPLNFWRWWFILFLLQQNCFHESAPLETATFLTTVVFGWFSTCPGETFEDFFEKRTLILFDPDQSFSEFWHKLFATFSKQNSTHPGEELEGKFLRTSKSLY